MDHFLLFEPSLVSYLLPASFTGANTVANTSTAGREGLLSLTHLLQAERAAVANTFLQADKGCCR